jgi:cation diffusion facilitator CzcD-associated flavoprotein CzcO
MRQPLTARPRKIEADVVVVGAGPAGLAAAAELERAALRAVVLERGVAVGAAWRARYDRLRLNSSRFTSRIRGVPYERGAGRWPSRDEFVAYLERAAATVDVRTGVCVKRIERDEDGWRVRTSAGDLRAHAVIVATGYACEPLLPEWPGRDRFRGRLLHAAEYRNADPFRDGDVLVAGAGSSGMEIAYDLIAGDALRVRIAVRTPPNIERRALAGVPGDFPVLLLARVPASLADRLDRIMRRLVLGDLRPYGLPQPSEGPFARLQRLGVAPAVVDPEVIQAIRDRRIEIVAAVAGFDETGVRLADGTRIEPDAVIAATGYRTGLEPLVGHLGVLDDRGVPRATSTGLHFVGFVPVPGQIRYMSVEARRAARAIAHELA